MKPVFAAAALTLVAAAAMAQPANWQGVGIITTESNPAVCAPASSFSITYQPDPTHKAEGLRIRRFDSDFLMTAPHLGGQGSYAGTTIASSTLHILGGQFWLSSPSLAPTIAINGTVTNFEGVPGCNVGFLSTLIVNSPSQ